MAAKHKRKGKAKVTKRHKAHKIKKRGRHSKGKKKKKTKRERSHHKKHAFHIRKDVLAFLSILFSSIDKDHNGSVENKELKAKFKLDDTLAHALRDTGMTKSYFYNVLDKAPHKHLSKKQFIGLFSKLRHIPKEEKQERSRHYDMLLLHFNSIDVDGNHVITRKELHTALKADKDLEAALQEVGKSVNNIFKSIDLNNDGKITRKEFINHFSTWRVEAMEKPVKAGSFEEQCARMFVSIDTDNDGVLSVMELNAAMATNSSLAALLLKKNFCGLGSMAELFEAMDADEDEEVTLAEFVSFLSTN